MISAGRRMPAAGHAPSAGSCPGQRPATRRPATRRDGRLRRKTRCSARVHHRGPGRQHTPPHPTTGGGARGLGRLRRCARRCHCSAACRTLVLGSPGAERRGLAAPGGLEDASQGAGAGSVREPSRSSGSERQVELRGHRIVRQLQALALAERGYALSPDELATTLGATTTLSGDVIARLAHGHGEDGLAAGAAGGRVDGFSGAFPGRSPGEGDAYSERIAVVDAARMNADMPSTRVCGDRTAAQLAAESFPGTAADAIMATTNSEMRSGQSGTRTTAPHTMRQYSRSL